MKKDKALSTVNSEDLNTPTDIDFNEWGQVESIPIFIQKCELLNTNLLKAIAKIDHIFTHKHSTMEDVEYLKNLELDFKIFSFVPIGRKINKKEFENFGKLDSGLYSNLLKLSLLLTLKVAIKSIFKKKSKPVYYYPDEEVKLNNEKILLYKNLITKHLNDSIISYCNFFDNQKTYKWDDKKDEFRSIIILNVEGYKFLNEFFEKLYLFFICLPFHILDDYTPKSIGFGFKEIRGIAENEPDLLKRKEIYAEGMAKLEMSVLGTEGIYYAFNMHEYPEQIKKYKKAIEVLEERLKHSTPTEDSKIEKSQVQNEKISVASITDFLNDNTNSNLLQVIQNNFKDFEGKRLAILIYLLQEESKIISIISNSKTHSRKQFIQLFKNDCYFDKFQAVNKYIDSYSNELNLPTDKESDADYINIKEKLKKIIENPVA
jgi:hypothetical protein